MPDSTLLGLPYLDAAQSQKHMTHNEALSLIDLSVQIALSGIDTLAPPSSPQEGDRWHVGAGASGAFAGHAGEIACWQDNAWRYLTPRAGWIAFVPGATSLLVHDGAAWLDVGATIRELANLDRLGIGTSADATNPLAAKLNALLFTARTVAEGGTGDLRFTLNKASTGGTLSQLYQSGYSGRAETGLIGDDHFKIRVSADGSAWTEAVDINPSSGLATFPAGIQGPGAGLSFKRLEAFETSGTFAKQAGDILYLVIATGGGGGGGAGRRSAAGTQAGGGAGGNGAHIVEDWVAAADVAASNPVTIGAGGAGAPASSASTNGASGSTGGVTTVFNLYARGGSGGSGGTNSAGGGAALISLDAYTAARYRGSSGAAGHASGSAGGSTHASGPAGGGGGAGLSSADVEASGGTGGSGDLCVGTNGSTGGSGGTPAAPDGGAATSPSGFRFGAGGGGGASKAAAAAGNGGAGSSFGGGGGGGGGGRNGQVGGAGGNGAAGRVIIYVFG